MYTAVVDKTLTLIASTSAGREVAATLRADEVPINVLPDDEFAKRYPGTVGIFDPVTVAIYVPEHTMQDAQLAAGLLAHEGTHYVDHKRNLTQNPVARLYGPALLGFVTAPLRLQNPVSGLVDGLESAANESEVNAHQVGTAVDIEIRGVDDPVPDRAHWQLQVNASPHYGWHGSERTGTALVGGGMVVAAGLVGSLVAAKVAPHSLFGRSPLARLSLPIVLAGVLVGLDALTDAVAGTRDG